MLKLMILGRRAPGSSRQSAQRHLKEKHGRLVLLPPADAGAMPADYVQNHVMDGLYPGVGDHGLERDLLTQIWFDDIASLQAATRTPYYLSQLRPDEPRFVDDASVVRMLAQPHMMKDGPRGVYKAFLVIGLTDIGTAGCDDTAEQLSAHLAKAPGVGTLLCNRLLPPPDGTAPFAELIFECWFETLSSARATVEGLHDTLDRLPAQAVDRSRCLALLAEEFTSERLLSHYGASEPGQGAH